MASSRVKWIVWVGGLLAVIFLVSWISGWGTVTLRADKVPLSKVLQSIARQGNVKIVTNADPETPVTLDVRRAPVFDVLDTLAVRIDGQAQLAQIAAPKREQITAVLDAFRHGTNPGGWKVFSAGFGGGFLDPDGIAPDPRAVEWTVSAGEDSHLQSLFAQGAQKTGALFALPKDWNPEVAKLPKNGKTGTVASQLARSVQGQVEEVFLITIRPPRTEGETAGDGRQRRGPRTVFSPAGRGQPRNPEWMAERVAAQIANLPADQQADARERVDKMRALWQSLRALSPEDRRAKLEEIMNDPEIQAQMEEIRAARDAKRTPEQRERRMKRYLERKERMKNAPNPS